MREREGSPKGIRREDEGWSVLHRPRSPGARALHATRLGTRPAGWWLIWSASISLLLPSVRAESDLAQAEPARWIAADAVVYVEVARPEVVIDRLTDPRILDYLEVLPAYRKFFDSPNFA